MNFINSMLSEIMFEQAPDIYASSVSVCVCVCVAETPGLGFRQFLLYFNRFLDINTLTERIIIFLFCIYNN